MGREGRITLISVLDFFYEAISCKVRRNREKRESAEGKDGTRESKGSQGLSTAFSLAKTAVVLIMREKKNEERNFRPIRIGAAKSSSTGPIKFTITSRKQQKRKEKKGRE